MMGAFAFVSNRAASSTASAASTGCPLTRAAGLPGSCERSRSSHSAAKYARIPGCGDLFPLLDHRDVVAEATTDQASDRLDDVVSTCPLSPAVFGPKGSESGIIGSDSRRIAHLGAARPAIEPQVPFRSRLSQRAWALSNRCHQGVSTAQVGHGRGRSLLGSGRDASRRLEQSCQAVWGLHGEYRASELITRFPDPGKPPSGAHAPTSVAIQPTAGFQRLRVATRSPWC